MITIIAAVGENNAIGKDNKLLWHLPDDFKRFKELTSNHYIIMGRKTFESFPKPLPNRTHVIITNNKDYTAPGCIIVNSLKSAIESCPKNEEIFIIGGGEIYKQSLEFSDKIELTIVSTSPDADTFFPVFGKEWKLVSEITHLKDDRHKFDFSYKTYIKLLVKPKKKKINFTINTKLKDKFVKHIELVGYDPSKLMENILIDFLKKNKK
jgi:dihydrofolate reductase